MASSPYTWAFLARPGTLTRCGPDPSPSHPQTLLDGCEHRSRSPRKKIVARAWLEMMFLAILHYKMRERPTEAHTWPEPGPKVEVWRAQWDVHGQDFLGPN
jgi:hypothetical protein